MSGFHITPYRVDYLLFADTPRLADTFLQKLVSCWQMRETLFLISVLPSILPIIQAQGPSLFHFVKKHRHLQHLAPDDVYILYAFSAVAQGAAATIFELFLEKSRKITTLCFTFFDLFLHLFITSGYQIETS